MPQFTFKPEGSSAPQQKIGLGLVVAGATYEYEDEQAEQAAADPDFVDAAPASRDELLERAAELGIEVPSRATRAAIERLIAEHVPDESDDDQDDDQDDHAAGETPPAE